MSRRVQVVGVYEHHTWRRVAPVLAARECAEVERLEGPAEEVGPKVQLLAEACRCGGGHGIAGHVVGVGRYEFRCRGCLGLHSSAWTGP